MRAAIVLVIGFVLGACGSTTSQRSRQAVAPTTHVPQGTMCPDLTGTFVFAANSPAARILVGKRGAKQGFGMLRIENATNGDAYTFTVKAPLEVFNAAAAKLAEAGPARYGEWQYLLRERERALAARESRDAIDSRIEAIGPLPDRVSAVWRAACEDYWVRLDIDLDHRAFGDIGDPEAGANYDLELWMARNAQGDLIYRIDRYRLRSFVFNSQIRTGRSRYYDNVEAVDPQPFDWTLDLEPAPPPTPPVPRSSLPEILAALSQGMLERLPAGAEITRFAPRDPADAAREGPASLVIDVAGIARRNADVAAFMRRVDELSGVATIELTSLRAAGPDRMEFELVVGMH